MGIVELVREHLIAEAREEGREEGLQKGHEKGREEGLQKGIALSAHALMKSGMSIEDVAGILGIGTDTLRQYLTLLDDNTAQ